MAKYSICLCFGRSSLRHLNCFADTFIYQFSVTHNRIADGVIAHGYTVFHNARRREAVDQTACQRDHSMHAM